MIITDKNGENSLYVSFGELAVNGGYIDSVLNLFEIRTEEIKKLQKEGGNEKNLRVFVKTSDKNVCELKSKDGEIDLQGLTTFLNDVQKKLVSELTKDAVKTKIEEIEDFEKLSV